MLKHGKDAYVMQLTHDKDKCESTPMARESMEYDVVIVGAGPAGLAAAMSTTAISARKTGIRPVCLCGWKKASEVGAHILSGAVIEPVALDRLLPNWKELDSSNNN